MITLKNNQYFYKGRVVSDPNELGHLMMKYKDETVFDELNFRKTAKDLIDLKVEFELVNEYLFHYLERQDQSFHENVEQPPIHVENYPFIFFLHLLKKYDNHKKVSFPEWCQNNNYARRDEVTFSNGNSVLLIDKVESLYEEYLNE